MSDFQVAMSTGTLCMDNSLRNSLSVKLGEFVNEVEILKKDRASGTSSQ